MPSINDVEQTELPPVTQQLANALNAIAYRGNSDPIGVQRAIVAAIHALENGGAPVEAAPSPDNDATLVQPIDENS